MNKVLLICGSNRKGNTEYILTQLSNYLNNCELILLRNKNIEYCKGCLACHYNNECIIKDDIKLIIRQLINANLIVFGVPNYFDNVSGLFKNFIDRLHPLFKSQQLKNKKVIFIFVGGGNEKGTEIELHNAIKGISKYLLIDIKKEFSFKALNKDDAHQQIDKIEYVANEIKKYI